MVGAPEQKSARNGRDWRAYSKRGEDRIWMHRLCQNCPVISLLENREKEKRPAGNWPDLTNNKEKPAANFTFSGLGNYRDIDAINKINVREHR